MQINDSSYLNNLIGFGSAASAGASATGVQFDPGRVVLADVYGRAAELGNSLTELDRLISTAEPRKSRAAWAGSRTSLNLVSGGLTATTLRSTEEVNATPTSFTPFGPDWDLPTSSDAPPTLNGIYDGSNGSGTLTFEARSTGVHGDKDLRFRVRDPGGNVIDNFRVRASDPIDQEYTLSNGLIFTLGDGYTKNKDTFTVEVFDAVGSVVDPNKSFDGLRNNKPNLEYGLSVTDGDFDINGVNIAVNASDSINDVLARITASAAGVNAVFDVATESVVLSRTTPGSAYDITLENDSSGFLQATKLDLAVADLGNDAGANSVIATIPLFASVTSGSLRINDVDIALDVNVDSIDDILGRITASDAFVSGSIINDRVYLQAVSRRDSLTLDGGGTGFFAALHIDSGRYDPAKRDGVSQVRAEEIATATIKMESAVRQLINRVSNSGPIPAEASGLEGEVQRILDALGTGLTSESGEPLGVKINPPTSGQASSIELDLSAFMDSLRSRFSHVEAGFLGGGADAQQGFVRQLLAVVSQFTEGLRNQFGTEGILQGLSA